MCDPASAMLALSVASAGVSYIGGQNQLAATTSAANSNLQRQMDENAVRQSQVNAQATDKMSLRAREAEVANGRINAISGESGVQLNGDVVTRDSEMAKGYDMATIEANRKAGILQTEWDNNTYKAQAQERINSAYSKAPSLIGTGLQIAGAGVDYYNKTIPKAGE